MNSYHHAVSASRKWGGTPLDYLAIEEKIDSSKQVIGDARHRSLYHHTQGVWLMEDIFGPTITVFRTNGSVHVPVREIAERHIIEDLGWLPSPADYIRGMPLAPWMSGAQKKTVPLAELGVQEPTPQEAS